MDQHRGVAARRVAGPGDGSTIADCDRPDLRGVDAGHRAGVVLLDVLEPVARDAADDRACGWPAISTPTCGTSGASSIRRRRPRWRAPSTTCCPNLAPFDVKAEVVHGIPVSLRHVAYTLGVRGRLHHDAADRRGRRFSAAATSSDAVMSAATVDPRPSNRWLYPAIALLLALSVERAGGPRSRLGAVRAAEPDAVAELRTRSPPSWRWIFAAWRPTSTGCARWSTTAAGAWSSAQQQSGAAPAANFDLLYPLLDLATSLDPHFKVAYRFGAIFLTEAYPSGPGRPDLAIALLRARYRNDGGALGIHGRHRLRVLLVASATTSRPRHGSSAPANSPGAPSWMAPLAATTLAEGGDRALVAVPVDAAAARTPTSTGCAPTPACSSSLRWTRSTN